MTKPEASIANRILLFFFVVLIGVVGWSFVAVYIAEVVSKRWGMEAWYLLTFGSAIATDRLYLKLFPERGNEKTNTDHT